MSSYVCGVVVGHLRLVVEVDPLPRDPFDLGDGVRHRRLHADAEDVELEEAQGLDVVLVELAHREAEPARLDRGAVEEPGVGQDDPARVEGDVPRQAVERLDEVEEHREPRAVQAAAAQLGQVGDGVPGVLGTDVRERLGDLVDLDRREPECGTDVSHGVAHLVGVHHRDAGDPLAAEAVEDGLVDLGAAGRLDVDVDVGKLRAQRGAEPLHEQPVADRVDTADAEEVVDEAARARPPGRDPHAAGPDEVGDLGDGEEVGRVAEGRDDAELLVEAVEDDLPLGLPHLGVSPPDGGSAALREDHHRVGARCDVEDLGLGEVDGPDAEVVSSLLGALLRDERGHRDEPVGAGPVAGGDLERGRVHRGGAREVAGVGDPVEVAGVEDDEPPGGVEEVDGAHLLGLGVAHRRGEHGGDAGGVGESEQAPRVRAGPGGAVGAPVQDDLDGETVTGQQRLPGREEVAGPVPTSDEGGTADVGVGTEEHEEAAGPRILSPSAPAHRASRSGVVTGMPRSPRRWVSVTRRHSAAQPTPGAVPPARPRASTVTRGRRGSTIAPPRTGVRARRGTASPSCPSASTARSTPRTGAMPARPQAVANRIAP